MFNLTHQTTIANKGFAVVSISIMNSWRNLTNTAQITVPTSSAKSINNGDAVTINLGYDYNFNEEFSGYVTRKETQKQTTVIHCEDAMYLLKKGKFQLSIRNATLQDVIDKILPTTQKKLSNVTLGNVRFESTKAQILNSLKGDLGLHFFFINGIFYGGLPYELLSEQRKNTVQTLFERNIIEDNLAVSKQEKTIKIKGVLADLTGKITTFEVGDKDGEEVVLEYYNTTLNEAKKIAESNLEQIKNNRSLSGTVTLFGLPRCEVGNLISITEKNGEKNGIFMIDTVEKRFGGGEGFRQIVTIGKEFF